MNPLLKSLKAQIKGVEIELFGEKYQVVPLSTKETGGLFSQAERQAKEIIGDNDRKLNKSETEEAKALIEQINSSIKGEGKLHFKDYNTSYRYEKLKQTMIEFSKILTVEVLRDMDGNRIYKDEDEKEQLITLITGNDEATAIIEKALKQAGEEKKSTTKD